MKRLLMVGADIPNFQGLPWGAWGSPNARDSKVAGALNLLGIPATTSDPSRHTCDLSAVASGTYLAFEVTGSHGTIGIEKGRQLMLTGQIVDKSKILSGLSSDGIVRFQV